MNIPSPRSRKKARIEIVPLIDIIFFLLATFVMVSLSMVQNRGLAVNLPSAASAAASEHAEYVTLSISADGSLHLDREPVSDSQLSSALAALYSAQGDDLRILIQGDEAARLGQAVSVLDECRRLGIRKVTFQTRTP